MTYQQGKIVGKYFFILLIGTKLLGVSRAQAAKPLDLPVCQVARAETAYTGDCRNSRPCQNPYFRLQKRLEGIVRAQAKCIAS